MQVAKVKKNKPSKFTGRIIFISLCLSSYFLYHTISGDRGLMAMAKLSENIEIAQAKLDILSAEQNDLSRKTSMLRDESLDIDLLDEQARKILGYSKKDETIYNLK